ncbi:hypothetical protein BZA77DRAFT_318115 [Pyronema omphalodes]|nr:hypothetical protein BZA77DRAFT_318115 [Pyronema omphalodes]
MSFRDKREVVTETGFRFKSIAASWDEEECPGPEPTVPQPTAATSRVEMHFPSHVDYSDSLLSDPHIQLNHADNKLAFVPAELIKAKPNGFKFVSLAATWEKEHYVKKKENGFEYRSIAATWAEEQQEKITGNTGPVHQGKRKMSTSNDREAEKDHKRQRVHVSGKSAHTKGKQGHSQPLYQLLPSQCNKQEEMAKKQIRAQRFGALGVGKNVTSGSENICFVNSNGPFKLGLEPTRVDVEVARRCARAKRFHT